MAIEAANVDDPSRSGTDVPRYYCERSRGAGQTCVRAVLDCTSGIVQDGVAIIPVLGSNMLVGCRANVEPAGTTVERSGYWNNKMIKLRILSMYIAYS